MGKSPKELRAYVDGNDPVTGRPVMQEVIEGLTPTGRATVEVLSLNDPRRLDLRRELRHRGEFP